MTEVVIRRLWILVGWFFFLIGMVGVFLPIMPTAPFIIVSAFCFSKGSPRLHQWLRSNKYFGKSLRDWEDRRVICRKSKVISTIAISGGMISPFFVQNIEMWMRITLIVILVAVVILIWSRPES